MPDSPAYVEARTNVSVTFIGAGNVATQLALSLKEKGCIIRQIISRHSISAEKLAKKVDALSYSCSLQDLDDMSDFYLIAVKDDDIPDILKLFPFCLTGDQVVAHTSGTFNEKKLHSVSRYFGCMYPLQTFQKEGF